MKRFHSLALIATMVGSLSLGCGGSEPDTTNNDSETTTGGKSDSVSDATMCAAIRGNGQLIPAHFGALARIAEHYGEFHAVSGGSSGSISSFMIESIQMNPSLDACGDAECTDADRRARLGLLYKSFEGYIEFLATTEEAVAVQSVLPLVQRIKDAGLEGLLQEDPEAARDALATLLEQDTLLGFVNPELIELVKSSPNPAFHVQDIVDAAKGFGSFDATDPTILVRPGIVSFAAIADQMSLLASFYAGYGPYPKASMDAWLQSCAVPGNTWAQVGALPFGDATCGTAFVGMLHEYRAAVDADGSAPSRGDDLVGGTLPSLISTSIISGDGVAAWEAARAQYNAGEPVELDVAFTDVKFGYFGDPDSIDAMTKAERTDLKSQMRVGLGQPTWREVLSYSPAEPGLSRALPVDASHVSAGGWSDLHPVLVMQDVGCDKVIYITREDPESNFALGVASLLGMTADDQRSLYALDNTESSFSQSLAEADAVWCTNWNDVASTDFRGAAADAYTAQLQSTDPFFTDSESKYDNLTADTGREGCSVPK